jgi:hypothetical protein
MAAVCDRDHSGYVACPIEDIEPLAAVAAPISLPADGSDGQR